MPTLGDALGDRKGLNGVGFRPQLFDINDDENVDIVDTVIVQDVFLATETDPNLVARSDLNGDGNVDILDVQLHVNYVIEKDKRGWLGVTKKS